MTNLSTLETIIRLAQQFGPFLFSILFILVVTRTAHGYYRESVTRKDPRASAEEVETYRHYFLWSVWVGIAVMGLSICWWVYAQAKGGHVYQVAIVDLQPDEDVLADYFLKKIDHPTVPGTKPVHDRYFLIVRDKPFTIGDRLRFEYFDLSDENSESNKGITGTPVETKYSGSPSDTYRLVMDAKGPRLEAVARLSGAPMFAYTRDEIEAAGVQYAAAPAGRRISW